MHLRLPGLEKCTAPAPGKMDGSQVLYPPPPVANPSVNYPSGYRIIMFPY